MVLQKEISHPNMNNRPTSWPITVKSSMAKDMQVSYKCQFDQSINHADFVKLMIFLGTLSSQEDVIDITVNALEKFTWASPDIAHFMKVLNCISSSAPSMIIITINISC